MASGIGYSVLIDGYNVIKQHPGWCRLPLAQARQQLVVAIQQTRWPVPVSQVTVIFDSAIEPSMASLQLVHIRIIFASPSTDLAIQRMIRTSVRPHHLLVISNDRAIMHTAKSHGTLCHPVSWFIHRSQPRQAQPPGEPEQERPRLTGSEVRRINTELARHWGLNN